ncbi:MAG: GNAT family N-acetyltransferase [Clostridia bacterium]|nr:GNAT family N-acetyltransferase [Clostridia bacterium]
MDITGIDNLGLERVLRRGSGEIIEERGDASAGEALLDRYIGCDCDLLMVPDHALGIKAFERYGFSGKLECYQVAYYGEAPQAESALSVRSASEDDLPMLTESYHLISPEELKRVVERKSVLLGYHEERLVGFIGEHLEGSMGILYVFPEYRRRGFGASLQKHLIAKTMEKGFIPFGQVEKSNLKSLRLQKKLGMTISDKMIVWMWK